MIGINRWRGYKYLSILMLVNYPICARAQNSVSASTGPNNAAEYSKRVEKLLDNMDPLAKAFEVMTKDDLPGYDQTKEGLKRLNEARAKAEEAMNDPQNAFQPDVVSEGQASLSNKDQDLLSSLMSGDGSNCKGRSSLICNGNPTDHGIVECSVGTPDNTMPQGWRHVALVTVQCFKDNNNMSNTFQSVVSGKLNSDIVKYGTITEDNGFIGYKGAPYSAFCVPCTAGVVRGSPTSPQRPNPNQGERKCTNLLGIFGICVN